MIIDPRQCWSTPTDFFSVLNHEFNFQLDAAATVENAKCPKFISPETNALKVPWIGKKISHCEQLENRIDITSLSSNSEISRVYVNPGFSDLGPWMKKAWEEAQNHPNGIVAVMSLISCSTDWWKRYVDCVEDTRETHKAKFIRLIGGKRIQFEPAPGIEETSNSRENCLVIFMNEDQTMFKNPFIHTWDWTETEAYARYGNTGRESTSVAQAIQA